MTSGCYLLHYEQPAPWRSKNPPRHYLGRSKDVEARIAAHADGRGGRFTAAMHQQGIPFVLARRWPINSYEFELRLKARGGAARICPICRGARQVRLFARERQRVAPDVLWRLAA